jgi:hypothetical protein
MTQESNDSKQEIIKIDTKHLNEEICVSYMKYMNKEMIPEECYKILENLKYSGLSGNIIHKKYIVKRAQLNRRNTTTKENTTTS